MMRKVVLMLLLGVTALAGLAQGWTKPLPAELKRIVFLGSSTTDGNTDPELLQQALREAGFVMPVCINAGAGGNTTAQIAARLERDVLAYKPTLVVLQLGGNDPAAKVTTEVFRKTADELLARLQAEKAPFVLLTTNIRGPKHVGQEEMLKTYNAAMRELAAARGCKLADAFALQAAARDKGETVLENDQLHPNFAGHRLIVRALLDTLGLTDVAVPEKLQLDVLPGVIRTWQLCPVPKGTPELDADTVKKLAPGAGWSAYTLPETEPLANWWLDCERKRGFALSLAKLGAATRYVGYATTTVEHDGTFYLNTGANLLSIWLDGKQVYKVGAEYYGWHAGRDRIPVQLATGPHTLVIETGPSFFLSLTENHDW